MFVGNRALVGSAIFTKELLSCVSSDGKLDSALRSDQFQYMLVAYVHTCMIILCMHVYGLGFNVYKLTYFQTPKSNTETTQTQPSWIPITHSLTSPHLKWTSMCHLTWG